MERLTNKTSIMGRKHDLAYGCASIWKKKLSKHYRYNLIEEAVDKLGQLEDIEEELGIDLITLFRALKDGIYCIDFDNQDIRKFKAPLCFNSTSKQFYWYGSNIGYPDLKDYGKTWSLDRSELKND